MGSARRCRLERRADLHRVGARRPADAGGAARAAGAGRRPGPPDRESLRAGADGAFVHVVQRKPDERAGFARRGCAERGDR